MQMSQLSSMSNLELAWRRITSGSNNQYKRFYRHLYHAYEVALTKNLTDLSSRLSGGTFKPCSPERVYVPKPSGLHRPLSLLHIEDQIVFQAFANLAAKKFQEHRKPLNLESIFSNILQETDSIFFFQRWQDTYQAFQEQNSRRFESGMHWVGDFDLAAFYETISHQLLIRTIYPKSESAELKWIAECLRTWSSVRASSQYGHGLPQGPLASDFLAECFLFPIDKELSGDPGYMRYVDDFRLFGRTEEEIRSRLIKLERLCRRRGLIPQAGKFAIDRVGTIEQIQSAIPSIPDPQLDETGDSLIHKERSLRLLRESLDGDPLRVKDKTRLRYVLYRAKADDDILEIAIQLIQQHPEHSDALFHYFGQFAYHVQIETVCLKLVDKSPYPYVRGEAWHVLARYRGESNSTVAARSRQLTDLAVSIAKQRDSNDNLVERWGACHFLCAVEVMSLTA